MVGTVNNIPAKSNKVNSFLLSWRLPWVIFTLVVFAGLLKLSAWQYQRGAEKDHRLNRIEQLSEQKAFTLGSLKQLTKQNSKLLSKQQHSANQKTNNELQNTLNTINDLPVTLTGYFDNTVKLLLDNQSNQGQLGYKVLQVFFDQSSGQYVLVNLGWIKGSIDRNFIPEVASIEGELTLNGHVRIIEKGIVLAEQQLTMQHTPIRIQEIDIAKISQLINLDLLPFVVFLDTKEEVGYKKNWQPVVMPPEKHRGYAFQWLTLAIAWLSLMLWASYKIYQKKH